MKVENILGACFDVQAELENEKNEILIMNKQLEEIKSTASEGLKNAEEWCKHYDTKVGIPKGDSQYWFGRKHAFLTILERIDKISGESSRAEGNSA